MTDPPDEPTPRLDAADRLERVIDSEARSASESRAVKPRDAQSDTLDRLDDKSGRIARLLGILLGVVLSSLSLGLQLSDETLGTVSIRIRLALLLGVGFLLLSLAGTIVTLLSSKSKIGLGHGTGVLLSRTDYDVPTKTHLRRVLGTYAHTVKVNHKMIEVNARRLRRALLSLLLGLLYLAAVPALIVGDTTESVAWAVLLATVPVASGTGWFVLSGRYLPKEMKVTTNE